MNNINYDDILSSYQQTRMKNMNTEYDRKQEIYKKIPRIKEIDNQIATSCLSAAKDSIYGVSCDKDRLRANRQQLESEKKQLLISSGYPGDYLDPVYNCSMCKDTGYVNGLMCSCLKQVVINELYRQSTIKDILQRENFDTFSLDYYSRENDGKHPFSPYENADNILLRSRRFVDEFDHTRPGILIYGGTGLGKTFISNCIAKALLDKGHTVLYLSSINLFENILSEVIMNNSRDKSRQMTYEYIFNCDLLIIDDLGTEMTNSFVQSQLFEIINTRRNKSLSTLISTNLSKNELQERYSERTMSRIVADFIVFNFYGEDIRYIRRKRLISGKLNN